MMPSIVSSIDWWPQEDSSVTQSYIWAHNEFEPYRIRTGRPYTGEAWAKHFISIPRSDAWKVRNDHIENGLTADLLAAVEILELSCADESEGGSPGGNAEGMSAFLPLLDGGVFVDFTQYEQYDTNVVHARQATIVFGAMALRFLLDFLRFEPPQARLKGERQVPKPSEIRTLLRQQKDPTTAEGQAMDNALWANFKRATEIFESL